MKNTYGSSLARLAEFSYSQETSKVMMQTVLRNGMAKLDELASRNQLPKANIPILEELLERKDCFLRRKMHYKYKART